MYRAAASILGLVSLALLVAVLGRPGSNPDSGRPLQIFQAQKSPLTYRVFAVGHLKYAKSLELRPEIPGTVKTILVEEGQTVQSGQTLIELDSSALQENLEMEKAEREIRELELARLRLERDRIRQDLEQKEILQRKGHVAQNVVDTLQRQFRSARLKVSAQRLRLRQSDARLRQLKLSLAQTNVRAPFDGVITTLRVRPGQTVLPSNANLPGSILAEIGDPESIVVKIHLQETDVSDLKVGMPAKITLSSLPNADVNGALAQLAFSGRESKSYGGIVFHALVSVENREILQHVRPGSSCRVEIEVRSRDAAVLVPLQAIHYPNQVEAGTADDGATVLVLEDEENVRERKVSLGSSNDLFQEVTRGLKHNETVLVGPPERLAQLYDGAVVAAPFEELRYADN